MQLRRFLNIGQNARTEIIINFGNRTHRLAAILISDYGTVVMHHDGKTSSRDRHAVNLSHQSINCQVATYHPFGGWLRQRDHLNTIAAVDIGFGDNGPAFSHGVLIPGTTAGVVMTVVHIGVGILHFAIIATEVDRLQLAGCTGLLQCRYKVITYVFLQG